MSRPFALKRRPTRIGSGAIDYGGACRSKRLGHAGHRATSLNVRATIRFRFGAYDRESVQIGFARVVADRAGFAYRCDVLLDATESAETGCGVVAEPHEWIEQHDRTVHSSDRNTA